MSRHRLIIIALTAVALAACGNKKSSPNADKVVETGSGSAGSGSAAPVPAAGANKLGPIDLSAPTIDLIALFPGATLELHPAEDPGEGGSVYDTYTVDTIDVSQGDKTLLVVELAPKSERIAKIIVLDTSIATPGGLDVGKLIADVATKHADATCTDDRMSSTCDGPSTGSFSYQLSAEYGTGAPMDEEIAIAKVTAGAKIGQVHWTPDQGKGPTLAKRPPVAAAGGDDEGGDAPETPRKPTADEIDRCAKVYAAVKACGVGHDYEFGWVKSDKKKLSPAEAKKACDVASTVDEDGMSAFPVPLLEADKVAKITAGATRGCDALKTTIDEVSPGIGPAGYDPSK